MTTFENDAHIIKKKKDKCLINVLSVMLSVSVFFFNFLLLLNCVFNIPSLHSGQHFPG